MNVCKCGCGTKLRSDNKTGYQKGHKPCPICGTLVKRSGLECCSKSCSAKLHWKRNPEMKENRAWNELRFKTRETNRESWVENISEGRKKFIKNGGTTWNKDKVGCQVAWNKGLPKEQQPFYGLKHDSSYVTKVKTTNLKKYGYENAGFLAKNTPISKIEKMYGELFLKNYETNKRIGKYKVDFVDESKKHIVEIYGDYWHCYPMLFDSTKLNTNLKMTAQQKWDKDSERHKYLENKGYNVDIIWERDAKLIINDYRNKHNGQ